MDVSANWNKILHEYYANYDQIEDWVQDGFTKELRKQEILAHIHDNRNIKMHNDEETAICRRAEKYSHLLQPDPRYYETLPAETNIAKQDRTVWNSNHDMSSGMHALHTPLESSKNMYCLVLPEQPETAVMSWLPCPLPVGTRVYKPTEKLLSLIAEIVDASPDRMLKTTQVYTCLRSKYPYFRFLDEGNGKVWRSCVRHALSHQAFFHKVKFSAVRVGFYWSVNPTWSSPYTPANLSEKRKKKTKNLWTEKGIEGSLKEIPYQSRNENDVEINKNQSGRSTPHSVCSSGHSTPLSFEDSANSVNNSCRSSNQQQQPQQTSSPDDTSKLMAMWAEHCQHTRKQLSRTRGLRKPEQARHKLVYTTASDDQEITAKESKANAQKVQKCHQQSTDSICPVENDEGKKRKNVYGVMSSTATVNNDAKQRKAVSLLKKRRKQSVQEGQGNSTLHSNSHTIGSLSGTASSSSSSSSTIATKNLKDELAVKQDCGQLNSPTKHDIEQTTLSSFEWESPDSLMWNTASPVPHISVSAAAVQCSDGVLPGTDNCDDVSDGVSNMLEWFPWNIDITESLASDGGDNNGCNANNQKALPFFEILEFIDM